MSTASENHAETENKEGIPSNGSGDAPPAKSGEKYAGITNLRNFLCVRRLELGMLVSRIFCMYFAIFHTFPIFGNPIGFLRRALLANAVTSAIRLYQRMGLAPFALSKEFIARLITEDSCHYLIYSIIFMFVGNVTFSMFPIFLVSSLHVANFILKMMQVVKGPSTMNSGFGSLLANYTSRTTSVLKFVAGAEIALMGIILFNCFRGSISILAPFVYYRFLYLRYASKRNQYTRICFYELRVAAEGFIAKGCPALIARIIQASIAFLCKLAPAIGHR